MRDKPLSPNAGDLFAFAVLRLGIDPETAWRLGLSELLLLVQALGIGAGVGMDRAALDALMTRFPDAPCGNTPIERRA